MAVNAGFSGKVDQVLGKRPPEGPSAPAGPIDPDELVGLPQEMTTGR